jgi:hypothetical protein
MRLQIPFLIWSTLAMSLTSGVQILRDRGKSLPVAQTDDEPAPITPSSNYGLPDCGSDDSRFVSAPGDGHLYLRGALFDFRAFK